MKRFIKEHREEFFDVLGLFFLMILFFLRWILKDHYMLFNSDIVQDFSMHVFAAKSIASGEIPLWDPYFTWGFIAYLNSGFFYPLNLLMNVLLGFSLSNLNIGFLIMQGNIFFHYFLASAFMYIAIRSFKLSRFPALVGAVAYAYCGYLVKEYVHLAYLQGAVWLPLVFVCFYKSLEGNFRFSILSGLFFGISLLAGQTQPAIYYLFAIAVLILYFSYNYHRDNHKFSEKPFSSLIIFCFISLGLYAIQLFPTAEYAKFSTRQGMTYEEAVNYSAQPLYVLTHPFVPALWGGMESKFWNGAENAKLPLTDRTVWLPEMFSPLPNEMNFYLGLLPLLLLPFAFFSKDKFMRNFFFLLLFGSVLLMMSRNLPFIGRLFFYLFDNAARVPVRASILFSFSIAFLAAFGLQAILDAGKEENAIFNRIAKFNFVVLFVLLLIVLPIFVAVTLSGAGSDLMPYFYYPITSNLALFIIVYLIYAILLYFFIKTKDLGLFGVILAFYVIELFSFHQNNSYIIPSQGSPEMLLGKKSVPEINYLKKDKDYFRVTGLGLNAYSNNIFSLGYGTTGSSGFAYRALLEVLSLIPDDASPILDLLNVKYLYTTAQPNDLLSSVIASNYLLDHPPSYAFDKKEDTEWVINPDNKNSEIILGVSFRQPEAISRIELLGRDNGLDKEVKDLELNFSDGSAQILKIPSKKGWKSIEINPLTTEWVKITVKGFDETNGKRGNFGFKEISFFNTSGKTVAVGSPKFNKIPDTNLYLNKNVFPRAFIVYSYKSFLTRNDLLGEMLNDKTGEQMRQTLFTYDRIGNFTNQKTIPSQAQTAIIKEYKNQKVSIEANLTNNGFLVLADPWYPGWKAYVDGKETPLLSAYDVLRAVQVPKGKHTIVFKYESLVYFFGAATTSVTVIILIIYFIPKKGRKI